MGPAGLPLVTFTILIVTITVFVLQQVSISVLGDDWPALYGMKINELILRGQLWRFFTPMFLHSSTNIMHIGFNMYALYIFGRVLEQYYGNWRFLGLYFVAGFAGNVMSFLFSASPSLGASTAVFGLLGAEGVFLFQNRSLLGQGARAALNNLILIGALNLFLGLSPGIDNWGHVGGLLAGLLFAWQAGPLLRPEGIYPMINIEDKRESGDVWRTLFSVGLLFFMLAAVTMYLRLR
jgi:rhomboid protease GluP